MVMFKGNAARKDPYKNFKFKVYFPDKSEAIAAVSKVSALKRTTEVIEHRNGCDHSSSRRSPGRTKYEAITLERGVTHDLDFEQWANRVWDYKAGDKSEFSKDFRRNIRIEMLNEAGQTVIAYNVFDCWVSEYQALPDLDANANAIAIQSVKLENEGWELDSEFSVEDEPQFTVPSQ